MATMVMQYLSTRSGITSFQTVDLSAVEKEQGCLYAPLVPLFSKRRNAPDKELYVSAEISLKCQLYPTHIYSVSKDKLRNRAEGEVVSALNTTSFSLEELEKAPYIDGHILKAFMAKLNHGSTLKHRLIEYLVCNIAVPSLAESNVVILDVTWLGDSGAIANWHINMLTVDFMKVMGWKTLDEFMSSVYFVSRDEAVLTRILTTAREYAEHLNEKGIPP